MESRKSDTEEPTCRQGKEMQSMDLCTQWGREGVGQMEEVAIYIHYQVGWILGRSCWEHGEPSLVPYDDLEGSDGGEEGGKGRRGWMYNYGRFELLYLRNQHTIVKKIFFN